MQHGTRALQPIKEPWQRSTRTLHHLRKTLQHAERAFHPARRPSPLQPEPSQSHQPPLRMKTRATLRVPRPSWATCLFRKRRESGCQSQKAQKHPHAWPPLAARDRPHHGQRPSNIYPEGGAEPDGVFEWRVSVVECGGRDARRKPLHRRHRCRAREEWSEAGEGRPAHDSGVAPRLATRTPRR